MTAGTWSSLLAWVTWRHSHGRQNEPRSISSTLPPWALASMTNTPVGATTTCCPTGALRVCVCRQADSNLLRLGHHQGGQVHTGGEHNAGGPTRTCGLEGTGGRDGRPSQMTFERPPDLYFRSVTERIFVLHQSSKRRAATRSRPRRDQLHCQCRPCPPPNARPPVRAKVPVLTGPASRIPLFIAHTCDFL